MKEKGRATTEYATFRILSEVGDLSYSELSNGLYWMHRRSLMETGVSRFPDQRFYFHAIVGILFSSLPTLTSALFECDYDIKDFYIFRKCAVIDSEYEQELRMYVSDYDDELISCVIAMYSDGKFPVELTPELKLIQLSGSVVQPLTNTYIMLANGMSLEVIEDSNQIEWERLVIRKGANPNEYYNFPNN